MFVDPNDTADLNTKPGNMDVIALADHVNRDDLPWYDPFRHFSQDGKDMINSWADYLRQENLTASQRTEAENAGKVRDQWLQKLETLAANGNAAAYEMLFNYYATRASELESREYAAKREDSAYQRLEADLRKAGISPYVLSGASPVSLGYSSKSYTGSSLSSMANNKNTQDNSNLREGLSDILRLVGIIVGALIMAA